MRRALALALLVVTLCAAGRACAGAQQYEPLSAAVHARLQRSVSDAAASQSAFGDDAEAQVWLAQMSHRLAPRMPDATARQEFLTTVHYEAKRAGLDPHLILGLIQVESNFRKYAVSSAGARGFMQVMPFWVETIGSTEHNLFHLRTSLRYGCTILRHYLDIERGDLVRALLRYNGSLGRSSDYAAKVIGAWRSRWALEAPPAQTSTPVAVRDPAPAPRPRRPAPPMRYLGPSS